jgi:hypothetical protein
VFQADGLRGLGALQLSVAAVTQGMPAPNGDTRRISTPLPSILSGLSSEGFNGNDGFWGGAGLTVAGSLVVEIQQGSVSRRWSADLASGTFQLPPCDQVRVSFWAICSEERPDARLTVNAALQPANAVGACKPWLWTAVGSWNSDGGDFAIPELSVPEGAFQYRVGMSVGQYTAGSPADFTAAPMEACGALALALTPPAVIPESSKAQLGGWYPISYPYRFVRGIFSNTSGNALSLYPYVQFEIRP